MLSGDSISADDSRNFFLNVDENWSSSLLAFMKIVQRNVNRLIDIKDKNRK